MEAQLGVGGGVPAEAVQVMVEALATAEWESSRFRLHSEVWSSAGAQAEATVETTGIFRACCVGETTVLIMSRPERTSELKHFRKIDI